MKKKNLKIKIGLLQNQKETGSLERNIKVGDFLKVVLLKRDPLTLRGYFEEIKGFCVGKSRRGGALKLANIVKQVRFYYQFHVKSIAVKSVKVIVGYNLSRRGLKKKRLVF